MHLKLLRSNLAKRGAGLMTGSSGNSSSSSRSAGVDLVPGVLGGTWTTTIDRGFVQYNYRNE